MIFETLGISLHPAKNDRPKHPSTFEMTGRPAIEINASSVSKNMYSFATIKGLNSYNNSNF